MSCNAPGFEGDNETRMNKTQRQRLLDVARACREAPAPERFNMLDFQHGCGTPGCAGGHYIARPDLHGGAAKFGATRYMQPMLDGLEWFHGGARLWFGIDGAEVDELFQTEGCGGTLDDEAGDQMPITNIQAAEYIEAFVARKDADGAVE